MSTKIKHIVFKEKETFIGFTTSEQPREVNTIITDKDMKRSDLPRHADFERAMDKLKPHLLIASGFQPAKDYNGNFLQANHFNDFFADSDEESERFGGLTMTGVLIQGKHAEDGVQMFGTKEAPNGDLVKIKTPSIPLVKGGEGWQYELVDILDAQIDSLLTEAELFRSRKKHGAGVQMTAAFPATKEPDPQTVNKPNKKKLQENLAVA